MSASRDYSIVIDGTAYTAGPGTITLYECTTIDATYNLMNFRLQNFPEGLWFELTYHSDSIDLTITSLADYRDYSSSYSSSYPYEEYPEQVHTSHFPEHSFDTVPVWTRIGKITRHIWKINRKNHLSNAGPWSDEDLELVATKYPISWYGLNEPEHVTETMDRIKAFDPTGTHKTLYYWNAETFWGGDKIAAGAEEDYFRDDLVGTNNRPLYDHTNTEMTSWWVDYGLNMANHPSTDGVFTDNTISRECDSTPSKAAACDIQTTPKSRMVKELAQSVPDDVLDVGNYLRNMVDGGNRFRMADADGSYFENIHFSPKVDDKLEPIIVSMQLAREASWKKKVVMW